MRTSFTLLYMQDWPKMTQHLYLHLYILYFMFMLHVPSEMLCARMQHQHLVV
jgi:hypothetical protein